MPRAQPLYWRAPAAAVEATYRGDSPAARPVIFLPAFFCTTILLTGQHFYFSSKFDTTINQVAVAARATIAALRPSPSVRRGRNARGAPARCLAGDRVPPTWCGRGGGGGGLGDLRCQDEASSRPCGPFASADETAPDSRRTGRCRRRCWTTAKDWAHGDVCVGEAETGWGARELGLAEANGAADKALSCNSPISSFPISPVPPPRAPPLATDHCLWRAAGGQGRVRSARGGHTVCGLSVGWRRRFASSAGRQVRSWELRCRRAAAYGGTTAGASGVDCRGWTIAGMAGICLRQGRAFSGGLVGQGARQPQGRGTGVGAPGKQRLQGERSQRGRPQRGWPWPRQGWSRPQFGPLQPQWGRQRQRQERFRRERLRLEWRLIWCQSRGVGTWRRHATTSRTLWEA